MIESKSKSEVQIIMNYYVKEFKKNEKADEYFPHELLIVKIKGNYYFAVKSSENSKVKVLNNNRTIPLEKFDVLRFKSNHIMDIYYAETTKHDKENLAIKKAATTLMETRNSDGSAVKIPVNDILSIEANLNKNIRLVTFQREMIG